MLEAALGATLTRIYEGQARAFEQQTKLFELMLTLNTRQAARALGSRGGRVTQERKKQARQRSGCPLCVDPQRSDVTVEMIQKHREHGAPEQLQLNGSKPPAEAEE